MLSVLVMFRSIADITIIKPSNKWKKILPWLLDTEIKNYIEKNGNLITYFVALSSNNIYY